MRLIFILLTLSCLNGCIKVSDAEDKSNDSAGAAPLPEYTVQELDEPNRYEVLLRLPEGASAVVRVNLADQSKLVLPFQFRDQMLVDTQALSNQKYLYQMGTISNGEFQIFRELNVQIPKDLVIQGVVNLDEDTSWTDSSRLFLMPGGALTTNGYKLFIRTGKLFALGGVIETFSNPETPSKLKDGGSIEVQADEGHGTFRIGLFGKNGKSGDTDLVSMNGQNGQDGGNTGYGLLRLKKSSDIRYEPYFRVGTAGLGGHSTCSRANSCGTDGKPGQNGERGYFCIENSDLRFCY